MRDFTRLKKLIEDEHDFPCAYTFKFIVPAYSEREADVVFFDYDLKKRRSKNANYLSISFDAEVSSSEEVIGVYDEARKIKGLIAL